MGGRAIPGGMVEPHHTHEKHEACSVKGCKDEAERSFPKDRVEKVFKARFDKKAPKGTLCKQHYKEFKKETKESRELERAGW